jgi:hypothetical protein
VCEITVLWWNGTDRRNRSFLERNQSQRHFILPQTHIQGHSLGVRLARPPRATESKGRQNEQQNNFLKFIFCAEQMFNYELNKEKFNK